jgi:hypothetical protein
MPSDPPLAAATTVRKGPGRAANRSSERRATGMPLTGRTTVTLDLKGCLEEVSRIAAGAGTQPQRPPGRDTIIQTEEPGPAANLATAAGSGPLKLENVTLGELSLELLQLFSTRGQNINQAHCHYAKSGGLVTKLQPRRHFADSAMR